MPKIFRMDGLWPMMPSNALWQGDPIGMMLPLGRGDPVMGVLLRAQTRCGFSRFFLIPAFGANRKWMPLNEA